MRLVAVHASSTTLRRAAWAMPAVYAVLAPAALALSIANGSSYLGDVTALLTAFALYAVVGALIASRQPTNPIGWLLGAAALFNEVFFLSGEYALFGIVTAPGAVPAAGTAAWLSLWVFMGMLASLLFIVMLFPAGRLPSPRWRPVAWIAGSVLGLVAVIFAFGTPSSDMHPQIANPLWIPALRPLQQLVEASFVLFLLLFVMAVAALVVRFRRSRGVERQQFKWIVVAGVVMAVVLFLGVVSEATFGFWAWVLMVAVLPVSIGIAILRYRLYDIDVLINRALVYGALTTTLAAAYVGSVLLLQTVLRPFTADNEIAVAVSTLAVVALFQPLRRRIQDGVDRRFYRSRYDAQRTLDAFAGRLRDQVDLDDLERELVTVIAETVRPRHAALWLRARDWR